MKVPVRIPTVLQPRTGGAAVVLAEGDTVGRVVGSLVALHPGLREVMLESDGSVKRFLNLFLGDEDVRYLRGLDTPVPEGSEIVILPAASGGRRR